MADRIIPMPIETIETQIEAPTSPVNEEVYNREHAFATELHGTTLRYPIELLGGKVNKSQFLQWYIKDISGKYISPDTADGEDSSKLEAFLLMFPPNQIDLIIKFKNHNLEESGKKILTKSMMLKTFWGYCVTHSL